MIPVLIALLPSGLLMTLGAFSRRIVAESIWAGLDRLNYQILFPALIFGAAARGAADLPDMAVIGLGVATILTLGVLLSRPLRRFGPERRLDFAAAQQTAWRFNTALGLAAAQALPEDARTLVPIAIGFAVPLANILAFGALSRAGGASLGAMTRMIALNPLFLASLSGLIVAIADIPLPEVLTTALSELGTAAVALALISIGAAFRPRALARLDPFMVGLSLVKLLALPGAIVLIAQALSLDPAPTAALTLFAALPTATAALPLASAFGADRALVAGVIAQSTALGCLTLPCWIAFVLA